jgi:hypothetical protein
MQTKLLEQLAEEILEPNICHALEDVNIQEETLGRSPDVRNIAELSKQCLTPAVDQAFTKVELKAERFSLKFDIVHKRIELEAQGLSAILLVLGFLFLVNGAGAIESLLHHILGR